MSNFLATEQQGLELLYRGESIHDVAFSEVDRFNSLCEQLELLPISNEALISKEFNIPQHYKELDVETYIRNKVPQSRDSDVSVNARVEQELAMYNERGLYPILQLLIYIIDTMRKYNLVWGVGRGSSVSSYILYLLGVHKVDSHKYNLDIKEFLK
jgi:DNA polymerase III alpha subunit